MFKTIRKCESLASQGLSKVLVRAFLENFFTYIMASVFVGLNESTISCLVMVLNFQGSQRVLYRWCPK